MIENIFVFIKKSVCLHIPVEKAVAAHSSTLAWKVPWTEEPGGLQSMGPEQSDTTERLHFRFSRSRIGEGMAAHCSVPAWRVQGRGAWGAAACGAAQGRTRLSDAAAAGMPVHV